MLATEINLTFKIGGDEKTKYLFSEYLYKLHHISEDIDKSVNSYYIKDWVSDVSMRENYDDDILQI